MMTLVNILKNTAKQHPDKIAVKIDTQEITYSDLYLRSSSLAKSMVSGGALKGDRIGFLFNKSIEAIISIYGIMLAGASIRSFRPKIAK